jgi:hypothetical protein
MEEVCTKEGEMSTNMQIEPEQNLPTQESQAVAEEEEEAMQVEKGTFTKQVQRCAFGTSGGEVGELSEEEQLDYEDDPMSYEKAEMEAVEKRVEIRANKLMETAAININMEGVETEGEEIKGVEGKEVGSMSATTEDDEEIDWDQVQDRLDKNMEVDIMAVKKRKEATALRRSERNKGEKTNIQEKAEAAKKKSNELTGTSAALTVLNSIDNDHFLKLAKASNINMGDTVEKIAASLSTIQANERAQATIQAAKKKMAEQAVSKELESDITKRDKEGGTAEEDRGKELDTEGGLCSRPSRKPPKQKQQGRKKKSEERDNCQKDYK